jgi:hypothetical protein
MIGAVNRCAIVDSRAAELTRFAGRCEENRDAVVQNRLLRYGNFYKCADANLPPR